MKIKTLAFVAVMALPATAQAVSVNFDNTDLFTSTVNDPTLTLATQTVDGLTLSAMASAGGILDVYAGTGPNGLAIGAPSNGLVESDTSGATNPSSGAYSLSFDKAVTSIEVTFGFLTNDFDPTGPETIKSFSADATPLAVSDIIVSSLVGTTYNAAGEIIPDQGVRNGRGIFTYTGAAFNSFSFVHTQDPRNISFVISNLTVELAPIPLPAALPLLGGGLALLGFAGWRRRRRAAI